jgi:hypothetical protein
MSSASLIHADAALNLIWVVLCVSAIVWQWTRARAAGTLAVFLAAVALFPCISASDDRVRLLDLDAAAGNRTAVKKSVAENLPLTLQLEDLEHAQPPTSVSFLPTLSFALMVHTEDAACIRRTRANSSSRGPPLG